MTKSNNFITCHPDAGFLQVAGPDAAPFLQSILTSNVETLAVGACRPSALLTPQGRVLIDMMLYRPTDHTFILRTDAGRRDDLFAKLRRYRLRRPVELLIDNDLRLAIYLGDMPLDTTLQPIAYKDPRGTGLGHHILFRHIDDLVRFAAQNTIENIDETGKLIGEWQQRRIAAAVPEGPIDLIPERALMLEAGLDLLEAVDFSKGCYIGQEVTARTHYRGLVKRRLVPLSVTGPQPTIGSIISWDGNMIGTSKTAAAKNEPSADEALCLALLKLSDIHIIEENRDTKGRLMVDGRPAHLAIPDWMRPLPAQSKP